MLLACLCGVLVFLALSPAIAAPVTDGLLLHLDAAAQVQAGGAGAGNTIWRNLADQPDTVAGSATLHNFRFDGTCGWEGRGTPGEPYALRFDGKSAYVQGPGNLEIPEVTLEAWARVDGVGCFDGHCLRAATLVGNDFGAGGIALMIQPVGQAPLLLHGVTFSPVAADTPARQWQQVVAVLKDGMARVYVNGMLSAALPAPRELQAGHFPAYSIGAARNPSNDYVEADGLIGSIAIVRVYGRALTAAEVLANFEADRGRFGLATPQAYSEQVLAPAGSCAKWDYITHPVGVSCPDSSGWPYGVRWAFDSYPRDLSQPYVRNFWGQAAPSREKPAEVTINYKRPVAVTRYVHYFDRFRTPRAWRDVDMLTSDDMEHWTLRQSFADLPPDCPQILGFDAPVAARYYRIVVKSLAAGAPDIRSHEIETDYGATLGNVTTVPSTPVQGEAVDVRVHVVSPDAPLPGGTIKLVAPRGSLKGQSVASVTAIAKAGSAEASFRLTPLTCGEVQMRLELQSGGKTIDRRPVVLRVRPKLAFEGIAPAGAVVARSGETVTLSGTVRNAGSTPAEGVAITWSGASTDLGTLAPGQSAPFRLSAKAAAGYAEGELLATAQGAVRTSLRRAVICQAGKRFTSTGPGVATTWTAADGAVRFSTKIPAVSAPLTGMLRLFVGDHLCPLLPVGGEASSPRLAAAVPGAVGLVEVGRAAGGGDDPALKFRVIPDDPSPLGEPYLDLDLRLAVDDPRVMFRPHIDWYTVEHGPNYPYAANGHNSATRMLCIQTRDATLSMVPDTDNLTWGFRPDNEMTAQFQIPLKSSDPLGETVWHPIYEAPAHFSITLPVRKGDWWDAYRHVVTDLFAFEQPRQWAMPITQMQMLNTRYLLRPEIWSEKWQTVRSHPGVEFFYNFYGTTYTLPALYSWYLATDDQAAKARAEKILEWLLSVQEKEGPLAGAWFSQYCVEGNPAKLVGRDQAWNRWAMPHAVGTSAKTLLWYWEASGRRDAAVLAAARGGCDWLLANQEPDGGWPYAVDLGGKPVSNLSGAGQIWCAWALWKMADFTGEDKYRQAALRSKDFFKRTFMDVHRYEGYWEDVSGAGGKVARSWEGYEPAIAAEAFGDMGDTALALEAAKDAATWSWTRVISTRQYETCYGETTEQSLCGPSQAQSPMTAIGMHRAYEMTGDPLFSALSGAIKAMNFCADPDQAYGMVATGGWDDPTTGVVGPPYENVRPWVTPNNSRGDEYGRQVWAEWETSQFAWLALDWLVREANLRAPEYVKIDPTTLRGTVLGLPGRVKMPEEKCDVAGIEHTDINWVGYQNDDQYALLVMNHKEALSVLVRPHEAHLDVWKRAPRVLVGSGGRFQEQPMKRQGVQYRVSIPQDGTAIVIWDRIK